VIKLHLWIVSFLLVFCLSALPTINSQDEPVPDRGWLRGGLAWSPDSTQLAVGSSLGVWIYAVDTWEDILFRDDQRYVTSLAWSPSGDQIASASGETIDLWDATTGETLMTLEGHTSTVSVVNWSPNGMLLVSGGWDNTVRLWDMASGTSVYVLEEWEDLDGLDSITWSPDGSKIAINGLAIMVWDAATGEQIQAWSSAYPITTYTVVKWLSDGEQIAAGTLKGDIEIWNVVSGELLLRFDAHPRGVLTLAQSPESRQLASIGGHEFAFEGSSRRVKVWDTATGTLLTELEKGITTGDATFYEYALAWSPDGRWLASTSDDGTVHLWDTTSWGLLRVDNRFYSLVHTDDYISPTLIPTATSNPD
jgi:WD40 repeat protein